MKKTLFMVLAVFASVIAFSQNDTTRTTLHADANTVYLDENGGKMEAMKFMQAMENGGYTMLPQLQDGRVKSLQLKRTGNNVAAGKLAPDFSVPDLHGEVFNLKDLRGKTVVLDFWFINCAGCVKEMPSLDSLAAKFAGDPNVVFLAITFDEQKKVQDFMMKHKLSYHIVPGARAMVQQYGIQVFPFSMVIDKTGHIVFSDNANSTDIAGQLVNIVNTIK